MIRNRGESDFPDVDRLIEEAGTRPPAVLDYHGEDPRQERAPTWLPLARFARRVAYAGAWALIGGGFGLTFERHGDGAGLLAAGMGLLGLIVPIPGARRRNAW